MSVSFFLPMEYIIWTYNIYNKSRQQWSEQLAYSPIYFFTHLLHYNNDPLLDRQQKWRTWCMCEVDVTTRQAPRSLAWRQQP